MALNKNLLKSYIVRYDGTQDKLADAMGISLSRLNAKINESTGASFNQVEIEYLKNRYTMTPDDVQAIFFDGKVS